MTRNEMIFHHLNYFSKSCDKMPTANHFISTVKAGRKLATPPDILSAKGKVAISSPDLP